MQSAQSTVKAHQNSFHLGPGPLTQSRCDSEQARDEARLLHREPQGKIAMQPGLRQVPSVVSLKPCEQILPVAWKERVHVHADDSALVTRVRSVLSGEQLIECRVERGCVDPGVGLGVEDAECFFPGEFAGEEECWLGNAVLFCQ